MPFKDVTKTRVTEKQIQVILSKVRFNKATSFSQAKSEPEETFITIDCINQFPALQTYDTKSSKWRKIYSPSEETVSPISRHMLVVHNLGGTRNHSPTPEEIIRRKLTVQNGVNKRKVITKVNNEENKAYTEKLQEKNGFVIIPNQRK